ncbi:Telomerase ribonucleoprotein complex RNA binding domain-containing protein [Lipomyces japonicus]|uniref:Telomerase ribonucleoprotein complex RNA binding domain-containing protein n=1 Tax=Lipomyces japonicus TaxID=56871 RepID=UPI0034CDE278
MYAVKSQIIILGLTLIADLFRCAEYSGSHGTKLLLKCIFRKQFRLASIMDLPALRLSRTLPKMHFNDESISVPKNLKGTAFKIMEKILDRHKKCPYDRLIRYYCPMKNADKKLKQGVHEEIFFSNQAEPSYSQIANEKVGMKDFVTLPSQVSVYVRMVLRKLLPLQVLGSRHNQDCLMNNVNRFVYLRRYEKISLHDIMQGLKISDIEWLGSERYDSRSMPLGEFCKRTMLLGEFVYWIFDGLIPSILRSGFYVSDTAASRNSLAYFRQDVWNKVTKPSMNSIVTSMFKEIPPMLAKNIIELDNRLTGFGTVRLMPKDKGVRLIMRLSRRQERYGIFENAIYPKVGGSINQCLKPLLQVFQYERVINPTFLGSSVFSSNEIYDRLAQFRQNLSERDLLGKKKLFFVKMDIKSCFDTIPQARAYSAATKFLSVSEYRTRRFLIADKKNGQLRLKWHQEAYSGILRPRQNSREAIDEIDFVRYLLRCSAKFDNKIVVDGVRANFYERDELIKLLAEHVGAHIVKGCCFRLVASFISKKLAFRKDQQSQLFYVH